MAPLGQPRYALTTSRRQKLVYDLRQLFVIKTLSIFHIKVDVQAFVNSLNFLPALWQELVPQCEVCLVTGVQSHRFLQDRLTDVLMFFGDPQEVDE